MDEDYLKQLASYQSNQRLATFFIVGFLIILTLAIVIISKNVQYQGLNLAPKASEVNTNTVSPINYYVPNNSFENWTQLVGFSKQILVPTNWSLVGNVNMTNPSYRDVGRPGSGSYAFKTPQLTNFTQGRENPILRSSLFVIDKILYRNARISFYSRRLTRNVDGLIFVKLFAKVQGQDVFVCGAGTSPSFDWSWSAGSCYLPIGNPTYYAQVSVEDTTEPLIVDDIQINQSLDSTPAPTGTY